MNPILERLLHPGVIWVLIPITWLVVTGVVEVVQSVQRHAERIAMIEQGMHPDRAESDAGDEELTTTRQPHMYS